MRLVAAVALRRLPSALSGASRALASASGTHARVPPSGPQALEGDGFVNRTTGRREPDAASSTALRVRRDSLEWAMSAHLDNPQNLDAAVACLEEAVADGGFASSTAVSILLRRTTRDADASLVARVVRAADTCGLALDGRQLGWALSSAIAHRDTSSLHAHARRIADFPGPVPASVLTRLIAGYFVVGQGDRALQLLDDARLEGAPAGGVLAAVLEETLRAFPREPPTQRLLGALEACESRFEAFLASRGGGIAASAAATLAAAAEPSAAEATTARLASGLLQAREAVLIRQQRMRQAANAALDALRVLVVRAATSAPPAECDVDALLSLLLGSLGPDVSSSGAGVEAATRSQQPLPFLPMSQAPPAYRDLNDTAPTRGQLYDVLLVALASRTLVGAASPRVLSRCLVVLHAALGDSALVERLVVATGAVLPSVSSAAMRHEALLSPLARRLLRPALLPPVGEPAARGDLWQAGPAELRAEASIAFDFDDDGDSEESPSSPPLPVRRQLEAKAEPPRRHATSP